MSSAIAQPSALEALSRDLTAAVERAGRAVVAIHARRRIPSSGVHLHPGIIVAASHTIQREEEITVTLHDGRTTTASLAGRDPGTDLAVLRIDAGDLATAAPSDATPRVGELVLALGRPGRALTASHGIVSAVGAEFRTWSGGTIDHLVRLDLAIYDGFSGGPLVDASGRVIGINTSGLSRGAALTIPMATVTRITGQLAATGRIARGYIGLAMQPVRFSESLGRALELEVPEGLLVVGVEPGGPGDAAGVMLGDVLVMVDGSLVRDTGDVMALLGSDRVGRTVEARVARGGRPATLSITIGERPRSRARGRGR